MRKPRPPRPASPTRAEQEIEQQRAARRIRAARERAKQVTLPSINDRRPAVLVVADVETWAWAKKARQLVRHLSDEFRVDVWYSKLKPPPENIGRYAVVHTFEFPQVDYVPEEVPTERIITGLTAHVWKTWGEERVRQWASRAAAIHANSVLLVEELAHVLPDRRVYYTPNGVCPETFYRRDRRPTDAPLVVGHVGKPNPRKGHEIIRAACDAVNLQLRTVTRRHGNAFTEEEMVDWYQDIDVILVASDMDGTPNPALEAAACECAVVSNRIGNMPEFVDDRVNGLLVERSVEGLAEALAPLKKCPEIARVLGRRARRTVLEGWTWRRQSGYYRALWRDVIAGNTKSVSGVAYGEREVTTC